jgi:hypothetical protein
MYYKVGWNFIPLYLLYAGVHLSLEISV